MRAGLWLILSGGVLLSVGIPARAEEPSPSSAAPGVSAAPAEAPVPAPAGSETGPTEDQPKGGAELEEKARAHFERALELYRGGDYAGAAKELNAALELDPNSRDLIYNLGLVYEKLGNLDGAIAQFERLLEIEKHPAELERVRRALSRLEGARRFAEARAAAVAPRVEPPAPPPPSPRPVRQERPRTGPESPQPLDGWVLGAGALALAAVSAGVTLGVAALAVHPGSEPKTSSGQSIQEVEDRAELAHSLAVAADIALAVGVVSGGVAFGLHLGRAGPRESGPETPRSETGLFPAFAFAMRGAF